MSTLLSIFACAVWIVLAIVFPGLLMEKLLLHIHLSNRQAFLAIFLQDFHETRPNSSALVWLPISAIAITFCQISILALPYWPFSQLPALGAWDLLFYIVLSLTANLLLSAAIWLGHSPQVSLFISQHLSAVCCHLLLLAIIVANIVLFNESSSLSALGPSQNQLIYGYVPSWNCLLLPIPLLTMLWLLTTSYHNRQNGLKSDLLIHSFLDHHSSFERLLMKSAFNLQSFSITLLAILLFFGGALFPNIDSLNLANSNKFLALTLETAAILIKVAVLLFIIRHLSRKYVEQTINNDIRKTIKIFLPANLLQLTITTCGHILGASTEQYLIMALALWGLILIVRPMVVEKR